MKLIDNFKNLIFYLIIYIMLSVVFMYKTIKTTINDSYKLIHKKHKHK